MKNTHNFLKSSLLFMGFLLLIAFGCKKEKKEIPKLSTTFITEITETSAMSGGNITSDGGGAVTARGICWSTGETPTIADNKTTDGSGVGEFSAALTGLTPGTVYYVRAYATNSNGTGYGSPRAFITLSSGSSEMFTDFRDGNVYKTVTIGNQVWMAENLRYLPAVSGPGQFSSVSPHYYVHGYDGTNVSVAKSQENYHLYGVLYNWSAAIAEDHTSSANPSGVRGVCPQGWHLPSDAEWQQLSDFLGGNEISGGKLKATGTLEDETGLWWEPNEGATNESMFTALPAGNLANFNTFGGLWLYAEWWTTTESITNAVWIRRLTFDEGGLYKTHKQLTRAVSIRCVKD
jgi:uncharacterized protein (TIGR02145 family)